ncbi:MAG: type III-B CRISPR module RAMP protein Cmr1 [candidate division WOR-3 bacterium]
MSSWLNLQKSLMESHDLIAEIDVETTTLTRIGGYKATPYSLGLKLFSIPTAKSLKGVWRWWARVAIVGAYNGKVNYKKANEHLNKILGGTGKDEGVSLFKLEISDIKFPQNYEDKLSQIIGKIDEFSNYLQKIPRVKLLLMKREEERVKEEMSILISEGLKFRISLYGSRDVEKVNFALSSLMLSLIFGGIGSITKRGFGSLRVLSFRFGYGLKVDQELQKIFQEVQDKEFTENELKEKLKKMCNITMNYAKRLFDISISKEEEEGIPEVPSLNNIRIEVVECKSLNLAEIGNAFVKQTWKKHPRAQGRNLHTWILGLPRFQKKTGYAIKRDKSYDPLRRISSIGVRFFKACNKDFIIIYGLLSKDWPENLYHIRRGEPREKLVREISIGNSIEKVFDYAFRKVLECIKSSCQRGVKSG